MKKTKNKKTFFFFFFFFFLPKKTRAPKKNFFATLVVAYHCLNGFSPDSITWVIDSVSVWGLHTCGRLQFLHGTVSMNFT